MKTDFLTEQQIAEYENNGYLVVRNLFTIQEIEKWQIEADRLLMLSDIIHEYNWRTYFRKFPNGIWIIEKFEPVIDISTVFFSLSRDHRIVNLVKQILKDNNIHLFKDKLIFKPPGQGGYPLHQDYNWWHLYPPNEICTVVVAIDKSNLQNGAIEFSKGCHDKHLISDQLYRPLTKEEIAEVENALSELVDLEPGDIVIFHSLTPHCSSRNMSNKSRRAFYPSYTASRVGDVYNVHTERHRMRLSELMDEEDRNRMFFK